MINIRMQTKDDQKLSPKIIVIGVGGAGGNAVNNMIASNLEGCEFLVCNTDAQALANSLCPNRVQLGVHVTGGLGAGSKPDIGRAAAEESLEEVLHYVEGANMAFVTAGMGGGTGSGGAEVIARACRERGILTVGVVTKPFHFEGTHRMRIAENAISGLQDQVDTLIVIPNQNLFRIANEKTTFAEAFRMADSVLQSGVRGVTDLMVRPGLVNLDFADIRTAMSEMGKAMMGTGEGTGERRAIEAAEAAINNPLLDDVSMKGAHGVIINVTGGYDMTLFEADEACNRIRDEVDPDANIIFGATFDESLEGVMRVSIVATGIDKENFKKGRMNGGKGVLERAKPQTLQAENNEQSAVPAIPVVPPYHAAARTATPVSSAAAAIRGITAPVAPGPVTNQVVQPKGRDPEPEADLFEQNAFSAPGASSAPVRNTAMRGTRYNDSFIPPRPIEAATEDRFVPPFATQTASFQSKAPGAESSAPREHAPPVPVSRRRSPSLFERITGTVQHHLDSFREEHEQRHHHPASAGPLSAPARKGNAMEAPAAKPRAATDESLDIPAFLRRQAN
ncbi:MAG: cell division protein FtsZ [Alphaproteobacteria bacterium]|nr:cell division protein FtsZ [Alphaproteobacteria bacterium]